MKHFIVLSALLIASKCNLLTAQNTYYYKGFGDLNQLLSWGSNSDGTGFSPANFTTTGDVFEIRNTSIISLTSAWLVTGISSKIIIGNGVDSVELIIPANFSLTGNVVVKNAGKLTIQNTTSPTIDSLFVGSFVYYAALGNQALSSKAYYDLEIGGTGSKTSTGDLTVNHSLVVNSTLDINTSTENLLGACSLVAGSGIIKVEGSSANPIPSGINWPLTVEFYRNGNQTIPFGEYKTLIVSGTSGNKSVEGGDVLVDSILSIGTNVSLVLGTNKLLGNFITSGTGQLSTTNTGTNPLPNNLIWSFGVTYSAADAGQSIMSGTYQILTITSGSNTNKATGNITILDSGTLQVSSANILDMASYQLLFGNNITVGGAGTIRTQNTSNNPLPTNQIWTQSISYNGGSEQTIAPGVYNSLSINGGNRKFISNTTITVRGTFTATSPVNYQMENISFYFSGSGNQTINVLSNFVFGKLGFSGGGTKTITSSIGVIDELSIGAATTVNLGTNILSGNSLTTVGNSSGLLRTQNTSTIPLPSNRNWNFRIQYDGVNQFIINGNYYGGLNLVGTYTTKSLIGDCEISDTISLFSSNQLVIGPNSLTITGYINSTHTGTFTGSSESNLLINNLSAVANTLYMTETNNESQKLKTLSLIGSGVATELLLGNKLMISHLLQLSNMAMVTNGNLVLLADSVSHAEIAEITGSGNIIGNVTIQLFINGNPVNTASRWRFLSSSVLTNSYIKNAWQNQIHITGPGIDGSICPNLTSNSNGFDCTATNNPSCYVFNDSSQTWDNLPSTNSTNLTIGKGLRLFIRGNRTQGCSLLSDNSPDPENLVLSATGNVHIGNKIIPCAKSALGFSLVGNPYQATIDWTNNSIIKTNILPTIYGYNHGVSAIGTYASYTPFPIPDSTNGMSRFISPGTSFIAQTNELGLGSIEFTESSKSVTNNNPPFLKNDIPNRVLHIKLENANTSQTLDEVVFRVFPSTSWTFNTNEDVQKMDFGLNQLALQTMGDKTKYSILRIPNLCDQQKANILVNTTPSSLNKLHLLLSKDLTDSFTFFFVDAYKNKRISLVDSLLYTFTNESLTDRFFIEWKHKTFLLSQKDINPSARFFCYPNPTSSKLYIQSDEPLTKQIVVKNIMGYAYQLPQQKVDNGLSILDISSLPGGEYLICFTTSNKMETLKFTCIK